MNNTLLAHQYRIASIVLNYNSADDVDAILPQLLAQEGIQHSIILVDNASQPEQVAKLQQVFFRHCPSGYVLSPQSMLDVCSAESAANCYLVLNNENRGYSAGNNIGIKLAEALGAKAVLVANPDMRIENPVYVSELATTLFGDEVCCIASSRILGLDGNDQNPLREPSFVQELAWPISAVMRRLGLGGRYIMPVTGGSPVVVPKVSGCCLMIRMDFLLETGFLDENVFLYCEEPILSSKARSVGKRIIFNPALKAVHAHHPSKKGSSSHHMLLFIESRRYYLERYSAYGRIRRMLMSLSYSILELLHNARS